MAADPGAANRGTRLNLTSATAGAADAPPVWYVRAMIRTTGPPSLLDDADVAVRRRVAWLVIAGDGTVLAEDRAG
jgi:hypothetical protein